MGVSSNFDGGFVVCAAPLFRHGQMAWDLAAVAMMIFPASDGRRKPSHLHVVKSCPPAIAPPIATDAATDGTPPALPLSPLPPRVQASLADRQTAMAAYMAYLDEYASGEHCEFRLLARDYRLMAEASNWPTLTDRAFGLELKFYGCKKYTGVRNKKGVRPTMVIIPLTPKKRRRRA